VLRLYGLPPVRGGFRSQVRAEGLGKALIHLLRTNPVAMALLGTLAVVLVVIYALALRGLAAGHWLRDPAIALLVASAAYSVVIAGGPVGDSRFRHPVMPFVCVLAAAGLSRAPGRSPGAPPTAVTATVG
jgi:hypothetical protein